MNGRDRAKCRAGSLLLTAGSEEEAREAMEPRTLTIGKDLSRPNQLPAIATQLDHVVIDSTAS